MSLMEAGVPDKASPNFLVKDTCTLYSKNSNQMSSSVFSQMSLGNSSLLEPPVRPSRDTAGT